MVRDDDELCPFLNIVATVVPETATHGLSGVAFSAMCRSRRIPAPDDESSVCATTRDAWSRCQSRSERSAGVSLLSVALPASVSAGLQFC